MNEATTDGFTVFLPSNTDTKIDYLNKSNTPAKFTIPLKDSLRLRHGWEVAIKEIFFPNLWFNIYKPFNKFIISVGNYYEEENESTTATESDEENKGRKKRKVERNDSNSDDEQDLMAMYISNDKHVVNEDRHINNHRAWLIKIPPGRYSVKEFCEYFNRYCPEKSSNGFQGQLLFNNSTGKLYFYLKPGEMVKIRHARLQKILGMIKKNFVANFKKQGEEFSISAMDQIAQFNCNLKHMFVYTNFIEYSAVGSTLAPLLRVINMPDKKTDDISVNHETFFDSQYFKVSKRVIPSIEIELRDSLGELIQFPLGEVFIVLKFRRRRQSLI